LAKTILPVSELGGSQTFPRQHDTMIVLSVMGRLFCHPQSISLRLKSPAHDYPGRIHHLSAPTAKIQGIEAAVSVPDGKNGQN